MHDRTRNAQPKRRAYADADYRAYPVKGRRCALKIPGVCTTWATTRDHILPLAQGGTNAWSNLRPACRPCNSARAAHTPTEETPTMSDFGHAHTPGEAAEHDDEHQAEPIGTVPDEEMVDIGAPTPAPDADDRPSGTNFGDTDADETETED